ncbi:nitroreductase [Streptococcus loxodontisalivarius]|uniref:Nitroreductase n=1 Tax=Streptococcus loxodontisalivarius TaxID=1349415 RepID=A0ABS2PRM9_9STRE|nr:nitroreductase [Streptococcus loxodontisalivarius]MBM7642691.1 nitroreductase [Streptococcus loxodontisalivarius]
MTFAETLKNRISIRDFKAEAPSHEELTAIVADAQMAPSWANTQPWKVYIATGDTMEAIRKDHMEKAAAGTKGYSDLPTKSRKDWGVHSLENMTAWLDKLGQDPKMENFSQANAQLWNAPAMAYITIPRTAPVWSVYDAGAFAQTLMLAAASRQVDTMVAYENVRFPDEIREHMAVSDDEIIVAGIALGYRSDNHINLLGRDRTATEEILTIK